MAQRRKAPNPKHDYMKSRHNALILIQNIKRCRKSQNLSDIDVWCEKEKMGADHIWVVRSNLAYKF